MSKNKKTKKFLVFSPHPDDVDFGFAGSAATLVKSGHEVVYCIITDGSKGAHKAGLSAKAMKKLREKEQINAAKVVGVKKILFLNEIDGEVENNRALRKKIVRIIRAVRPDVIVSPDPANKSFTSFYGFHRDHRQSAEAAFDSVYPASGSKYFFLYLYPKFKPHHVNEAWFWNPEKPNKFIDISKTFRLKLKALREHESQFKDFSAVEKRVAARARLNGKKSGAGHAESFRRLTL